MEYLVSPDISNVSCPEQNSCQVQEPVNDTIIYILNGNTDLESHNIMSPGFFFAFIISFRTFMILFTHFTISRIRINREEADPLELELVVYFSHSDGNIRKRLQDL